MLRWSTPRLFQSGFEGREIELGGRLSIDGSASEHSLNDGLRFDPGIYSWLFNGRFDSSKIMINVCRKAQLTTFQKQDRRGGIRELDLRSSGPNIDSCAGCGGGRRANATLTCLCMVLYRFVGNVTENPPAYLP